MDQAKVSCIYFKVSTLTQGKWPLAYITLGSKVERLETGWDLEHIVNSHETEGHQNDAMPGYSQGTRLKQV